MKRITLIRKGALVGGFGLRVEGIGLLAGLGRVSFVILKRY